MEIVIPCGECALAAQNPEGGYGLEGVLIPTKTVHVQEQRVYRATCPMGHPLLAILDHHAYELLFQSGLEALVDGYFRESVSSFAAALERLYEFSIRVHLTVREVKSDEIDKMWKSVSSQSERQLGMYIGIRTAKDGYQPSILSTDQTKFRNSVIHKGYFPSAVEAVQFGETVFSLILDEVRCLDDLYKGAVIAQIEIFRKKALLSLNEGENPSFLNIGLTVSDRSDRPFSEVVTRMQALKRRGRAGDPKHTL